MLTHPDIGRERVDVVGAEAEGGVSVGTYD